MTYRITTRRGYDFYEVASSLQKAIRRNDPRTAGYFAMELFESGYSLYCWKRLLTVSAEDCAGIITREIKALYDSWVLINKGRKEKGGRIFISKAVLILCQAIKSRDADHLQNLIYDRKIGMSDEQIQKYFAEVRKETIQIPGYANDCHTLKGKNAGKTKKDFFKDEFQSMTPKQPGLFDDELGKFIKD